MYDISKPIIPGFFVFAGYVSQASFLRVKKEEFNHQF